MNKKLSAFSLTLITVCSVDSVRNLPIAALAGSYIIHYFVLALFFFLLPCTIIACWFSTQSSLGIYGWIKKGLGIRLAFIAVCFQCIQNILLYPTFFCFIAGTLLFTISPSLPENKYLVFLIIMLLLWGLTWINLKGIHFSSKFNSFCCIAGVLIPFVVVLGAGLYWWHSKIIFGEPMLPQATEYSWTSLTAIILSFCGIELTGVHANESEKGAFSKALILAALIIFITMLFGAITLAMIIPLKQLNFISSIPQLITLFFAQLNCPSLSVIINVLIAIGCIGGANNWLIIPIKSLGFVAEEGGLSSEFSQLNEHQVPAKPLILQSIIITLLSSVFLIVPTINTSYWMMINAATQVLLLMYLLLFLSAVQVVFKEKQRKNNWVLIPACFGLIGCVTTIVVSMAPPPSLNYNEQLSYFFIGLLFLLFSIILPLRHSKLIHNKLF